MTDAPTPGKVKPASVTRRRRRERQLVVFGVVIIVLTALTIASLAIYRGSADGPFSVAIHTPAGVIKTESNLVCPPPDTKPVAADQVVVRVNNATETSGLAGTTATALDSRGFRVVGSQNWSRTYDGTVRILFGENGVAEAYTLALQFTAAELTLDQREDVTLDLILGEAYATSPGLRSESAPELDPELNLSASETCLPVDGVEARLAPGDLPANPLATISPEPSPEPSEG
ncbi:LytR C-terminal domain-containing protein [Demequina sediminicola]|uniref:LytR C-terminal domain-containing protein n=1 Tax=Demequina sediminicola TaxID=1095026 RepID=UPI000AB49F45|nr:LytR C-terminal domain-containing protein [Demequina sediminicola]